jgi:hypothetical protein
VNDFNYINSLVSNDYIKIQELTFLPEYYLISILFCITLFYLFALKPFDTKNNFSIKFKYNNQLIFLVIFFLFCYLILIYQQTEVSMLNFNSFNETIFNDQLALISKIIICFSVILYFVFISKYLNTQKLNNFEYCIILITSVFGFFLLCDSNDFLTAYLAIELQGLSFYVLVSFKKSSNFSIESGIKYFVIGSLSTAIFLLGTTFIYGLSGSINLTDFKDLFIWVFSANSFFLSFESIPKALELYQVQKLSITDSSEQIKLQIISDKFDLLKKKAYFSNTDIDNLKSFKSIDKDFFFFDNLYKKLISSYKNINNFSYFYYQDNVMENILNPSFTSNYDKILKLSDNTEVIFEKLFYDMPILLGSFLVCENDVIFQDNIVLPYFYGDTGNIMPKELFSLAMLPEELNNLNLIFSDNDAIAKRLIISSPFFFIIRYACL